MYRNFSIVPQIMFGRGAFNQLGDILESRRVTDGSYIVFVLDDVFKGKALEGRLPQQSGDLVMKSRKRAMLMPLSSRYPSTAR